MNKNQGGLLWADGKKVQGCPSGNVSWQKEKPFDGNRKAENAMLYSALRCLNLKGRLAEIYETLDL